MSKQFFFIATHFSVGPANSVFFRKNYIWTRCYFSQENQKKMLDMDYIVFNSFNCDRI